MRPIGARRCATCQRPYAHGAGMTWRARSSPSARLRPEDGMQALNWHLVTGEYAPASGGVADYTRGVARALAAAGDDVHVWAPSIARGLASDPGVHLPPI